jgi:hypothetical protein
MVFSLPPVESFLTSGFRKYANWMRGKVGNQGDFALNFNTVLSIHSPQRAARFQPRRTHRSTLVITECLEMWSRVMVSIAALAATSVCWADGTCDATMIQQYRDCAHIIGSLRPEKAGQARVFAYDGSEYTGGQAVWMKGQLRKLERLCASGTTADKAEAARVLMELETLLKSHQRNS